MFLLTIGGDLRFAHLTRIALSRSIEASALGMEHSPLPLPRAAIEDISRADAIILPNPWRRGMLLPYSDRPFSLDEMLEQIRPDTPVILPDCEGMPAALRNRLLCIDLSSSGEYALKNARLTAEGALSCATKYTDRALMYSKCLIIGYGRIAKRLAQLLKGIGADTIVAARREEVRAQASADGHHAISMEEIPILLPQMDFIFSTPPARVLTDRMLGLIRPDTLLMDLASPPFGFKLETAQALNLLAVRESGLPGRYCPYSAGEILLDAALDALSSI